MWQAACSLLGLANAAVFLIDLRAQVQATIQDKAVPLLQEVTFYRTLDILHATHFTTHYGCAPVAGGDAKERAAGCGCADRLCNGFVY